LDTIEKLNRQSFSSGSSKGVRLVQTIASSRRSQRAYARAGLHVMGIPDARSPPNFRHDQGR
jgi:hypothetical protein